MLFEPDSRADVGHNVNALIWLYVLPRTALRRDAIIICMRRFSARDDESESASLTLDTASSRRNDERY